jgi:hypothetical protein
VRLARNQTRPLPRRGGERPRRREATIINQPSKAIDRLRDTAWQLPWLRLHLTARDLLKIPVTSYAWPAAKRALEECAKLRLRMIETGSFN